MTNKRDEWICGSGFFDWLLLEVAEDCFDVLDAYTPGSGELQFCGMNICGSEIMDLFDGRYEVMVPTLGGGVRFVSVEDLGDLGSLRELIRGHRDAAGLSVFDLEDEFLHEEDFA